MPLKKKGFDDEKNEIYRPKKYVHCNFSCRGLKSHDWLEKLKKTEKKRTAVNETFHLISNKMMNLNKSEYGMNFSKARQNR